MLVVRDVVLALDRKGGDLVLVDQRGSNIILCGERVGGGQDDIRTAFLQGPHQVGRLARYMQAGRDAQVFERLLLLEALADLAQDRHLKFRPIHPAAPALGLVDVFDIVVVHCCSFRCVAGVL